MIVCYSVDIESPIQSGVLETHDLGFGSTSCWNIFIMSNTKDLTEQYRAAFDKKDIDASSHLLIPI
jgi:hypothetical protein